MGSSSKVYQLSLTAFAILIANCYCSAQLSRDCNVTRQYASKLFMQPGPVHNSSRTDKNLAICTQNDTCCTRALETKLRMVSEEVMVKMFSQVQGAIKHAFSNNSQSFSVFFKSLIETSYKNLDSLYSRTYLEKYTNHKAIFKHLFTKLGNYMTGKEEMDLKQTVDSWFSLLYQKVYMISNPDFHFDASYQHCILETADMLKPFGDYPRKISLQVKKSFLASKVLQEALVTGKTVVDELLKMKTHKKCTEAFMKMTHCGVCSGAEGVRPCFNYCMNVMKGCSAYPAVVSPTWNSYINALLKLASKVDGPFSMEVAVEPLGVKISEGIMTFQLNRQNISTHVIKRCGMPSPSGKRGISKRGISDEMAYPYTFDTGSSMVRPTTASGTSLDRLIKSLKTALGAVKDHWVSLPNVVCASGLAAHSTQAKKCWNGDTVGSYLKPLVKDGIDGMFRNPEVPLNITDPYLTVTRQVIKLKEITQRILSAANGADSNTFDLEEGSGETSGDGSGVGSGSGEGSGEILIPTQRPRTNPPISTDIIDNGVEVKKTTPFRPPTTTMGNFIPHNDGPEIFGPNDSGNGAEVKKAVGVNPRGSATSLLASYGLNFLIFAVIFVLMQ